MIYSTSSEGQMNPPHFYLVKEMPLFSKTFDTEYMAVVVSMKSIK